MAFFSSQMEAFSHAVENDGKQQNVAQQAAPSTAQQSSYESEVISEAEVRLSKANYYKAILNQPLFGDDEESVAYEVEQEIRDFVVDRLSVLLGMKQEIAKVAIKEFSDERREALEQWADNLLSKPHLLALKPGAPPKLQQAKVEPVLTPVASPTLNKVQPQITEFKRGRGRPPGTGKHQKAAQQQVISQVPAKNLPEGVKIDEDGKKYIEIDQEVVDDNGKLVIKKTKVTVGGVVAPSVEDGFKPMPSEAAALQHSMSQATMVQHRMGQANPLLDQMINNVMGKR